MDNTLVKASEFSQVATFKKALYSAYCGAAESLAKMISIVNNALIKKGVVDLFVSANTLQLGQQATMIAGELQKTIRKYYSDLRIGEFEIIVEKGLIGTFGEVFQLNYVTIAVWIKKYYESEGRRLAIEEKKKSDSAAGKPKLTQEEKDLIVKQGVIEYWHQWKDAEPEDRWRVFGPDSPIGFRRGQIAYAVIVKSDDSIRQLAEAEWLGAVNDVKNGRVADNRDIWVRQVTQYSDYQKAIQVAQTRAVEKYFYLLEMQGTDIKNII